MKLPSSGESFTYKNMEFVALGEEQGGLMAMAAPLTNEMPFNKNGNNDWRQSDIRKYLNEEWIKSLATDDLLLIESDLTSDCGQKDYGVCKDYAALLSDELYRKYREVVLQWLKKHNIDWSWHLTPWRTPYAGFAYGVRLCYTGHGGALGSYIAYNSLGVAPLVIFNPNLFNRPDRDNEDVIKELQSKIERQNKYIQNLEDIIIGVINSNNQIEKRIEEMRLNR